MKIKREERGVFFIMLRKETPDFSLGIPEFFSGMLGNDRHFRHTKKPGFFSVTKTLEKTPLLSRRVFFIICLVLMISISTAQANAPIQASLQNFFLSYGPGQPLEGDLNLLVIKNASAETPIRAYSNDGRLNATISLFDLLNKVHANFTCSPSDCNPFYSPSSGRSSVSVSTEGFKPTEYFLAFIAKQGNETSIVDMSFNVTGSSDVESQGIPPISIDLFDDGVIDWSYMEPGSWSSQIFGSNYNDNNASFSYLLSQDKPLCEKINLYPSGRFKLGAPIEMSGSSATLEFTIADMDKINGTRESEPCTVNANSSGFAECEVNFSATEQKDYYICVAGDVENSVLIKGERDIPACGHAGSERFNCSSSSIDYGLYATPSFFKGFNNVTSFNLDSYSDFTEGKDLISAVQSHIIKKYKSSCPSGGCIIPVKVISRANAVFSDPKFIFSSEYGGQINNLFYPIQRNAASMNMNSTTIPLSMTGFDAPSLIGKYAANLWIGDIKLKQATITVENVPTIYYLQPQIAFAETDTRFTTFANVTTGNIASYSWDFGDESFATTQEPFVIHRYSAVGKFTLKLTVTDSRGFSSTRSFDVDIEEPKDAVNSSLQNKRKSLSNFTSDIGKIPKWYAEIVRQRANVNKMSSDLSLIESDFSKTNPNYIELKEALDSFPVYTAIKDNEIGLAVIVPKVNSAYLKPFGEDIPIEQKEDIEKKIYDWNGNLRINAHYLVKYASSDIAGNDLDLATIARITLDSDEELQNVYFVLMLPSGVSYKDVNINGNYTMKNLNGAMGFVFDSLKSQTIEIALPGKNTDLEMFASPLIATLQTQAEVHCGNTICETDLGETYAACPSDCPKPLTSRIVLSIVILIVLAGGIYFIWAYYAKKYDKQLQAKLFKEKSDFVKLTEFISGELNKGKDEKSLKKDILAAGWNPEQVEYALKKVKKRTKEYQRQTVLAFIGGEKAAGKIETEIRKELKEAGWKDNVVNWGFRKSNKIERRRKK